MDDTILRPLWDVRLDGVSWSTPAVVTTPSGDARVVIADRSGTVCAFAGPTGDLLWRNPGRSPVTASPVPVDADRDGRVDTIVLGDHHGWLHAIDPDTGLKRSSTKLGSCIRSSAASVTADGGEVDLFVAAYGNWMYRLASDTHDVIWRRYVPKHELVGLSGVVSSPLVADVNFDGELEVVVGSRSKLILCYKASTGVLEWVRTLHYDVDSSPSFAIVAGLPLVFVGGGEHTSGRGDNSIYALRGSDGATIWRTQLKGGCDSSPTIADIDDDGRLEVVATSLADASCYALDAASGDLLWRHQFGPTTNCTHDADNVCRSDSSAPYFTEDALCRSYTSALVADLDSDGRREVVIGSNNGTLAILNGSDGTVRWTESTGAAIRGSPVLADLNGDGQMDLLVVSGERLVAYGTNCRGAPWPMFKGEASHLGCVSVSTSPDVPTASLPRQRVPRLRLIWHWLVVDTARFFVYQVERRLLRPFGWRLFDYTY